MSETIKAGDRVKVTRTTGGYANLHRGRTGTVQAVNTRYRSSFYGHPYGTTRETVYRVLMDSPRPEQIDALAVEKLKPSAEVGDRVRVRKTDPFGMAAKIDGQFGRLAAATPGAYRVELEEFLNGVASTVTVSEVDKVTAHDRYDPPTAEVGDDVVILRVHGGAKVYVGSIGKVTRIVEPLKIGGDTRPRLYEVDINDGTDVPVDATKVAKAPAQPGPASTVTAVEDDVEVLIDRRRYQAATAAHDLLGKDNLDDLIALADYLANEDGDKVKSDEPADPLADWERELLEGVKPKRLSIDKPVAGDRIDVAPSIIVEDAVFIRVGAGVAHFTKADARRLADTLRANA